MNCNTMQGFLPDMLLDSAATAVPAEARRHLAECAGCRQEWNELQATMQLLDTWETPEPSPYFDTRMAARLREEKNSTAAGWLERMRARLWLDGDRPLRAVLAAALALLAIVGAGSYEGYISLNRTEPTARPTVSATVSDLELLDRNAQTLAQLTAFDSTNGVAGQGSIGSNPR